MPRKKKAPESANEPKPPPKKRGRKPKKKNPEDLVPKVPKKRGRKPKGGKIIKKENLNAGTEKNIQHNIILHLKCPSGGTKYEVSEVWLVGCLNFCLEITNIY